jgi:hypothetical protein
VQKMAKSPSGIPNRHTLLFERDHYIVIDLQKPQSHAYDQDNLIRSHLGNGRSVFIKGQRLEGPSVFTCEEIEAYKGSVAQSVQFQGAYRLSFFQ